MGSQVPRPDRRVSGGGRLVRGVAALRGGAVAAGRDRDGRGRFGRGGAAVGRRAGRVHGLADRGRDVELGVDLAEHLHHEDRVGAHAERVDDERRELVRAERVVDVDLGGGLEAGAVERSDHRDLALGEGDLDGVVRGGRLRLREAVGDVDRVLQEADVGDGGDALVLDRVDEHLEDVHRRLHRAAIDEAAVLEDEHGRLDQVVARVEAEGVHGVLVEKPIEVLLERGDGLGRDAEVDRPAQEDRVERLDAVLDLDDLVLHQLLALVQAEMVMLAVAGDELDVELRLGRRRALAAGGGIGDLDDALRGDDERKHDEAEKTDAERDLAGAHLADAVVPELRREADLHELLELTHALEHGAEGGGLGDGHAEDAAHDRDEDHEAVLALARPLLERVVDEADLERKAGGQCAHGAPPNDGRVLGQHTNRCEQHAVAEKQSRSAAADKSAKVFRTVVFHQRGSPR